MSRSRLFRAPTVGRTGIRRWCFIGLTALGLAMNLSTAAAADDGEEEEIDFHGPNVHPGYPDAFYLSYTLRKSAVSPNGKYGVIFPDRTHLDDPANFLVAVKESRILGEIDFEPDDIYFAGKNHGGLTVSWAPDSSVVLVVTEGKWTPRELIAVELKDGRIVRQTPLFAALEKRIHAAAPKAAELQHSMVELQVNDIAWNAGKSLQLQLKCEVSTNPKGMAGQSSWSGSVVALWNAAQHKFTEVKVRQTSFQKGGRDE